MLLYVQLTCESWAGWDQWWDRVYSLQRQLWNLCRGVPLQARGESLGAVSEICAVIFTLVPAPFSSVPTRVSVRRHARNDKPPSYLRAIANVPFWGKGVREGRGKFY